MIVLELIAFAAFGMFMYVTYLVITSVEEEVKQSYDLVESQEEMDEVDVMVEGSALEDMTKADVYQILKDAGEASGLSRANKQQLIDRVIELKLLG